MADDKKPFEPISIVTDTGLPSIDASQFTCNYIRWTAFAFSPISGPPGPDVSDETIAEVAKLFALPAELVRLQERQPKP